MSTIHTYTAPEATVICGAVFDDAMEDQLRVTVVATGLGAKVKVKPVLVPREEQYRKTGTFDVPSFIGGERVSVPSISDPSPNAAVTGSLDDFFTPNPRGNRDSRAQAMSDTGMDKYDIPAFLRKQAD